MSMTFSGSGTITGLVAGGLPDAVVTSSDLAANAVDSQSLTLFNASGSAPVYACRAWVNFNGTGTVAIRASGNVSSITDNGTGDYTVNFATAMPDANYSPVFGAQADQIAATANGNVYGEITRFSNALSASSARVGWGVGGISSRYDPTIATVAIFR